MCFEEALQSCCIHTVTIIFPLLHCRQYFWETKVQAVADMAMCTQECITS